MVLPGILIHTDYEWSSFANQLLFPFSFLSFILFHLKKGIVGIWHPFIVSEQSTTSKFLNSWVWWFPSQVWILFFPHQLDNRIGKKVVRQVSKGGVITGSEATHDCVLFFVGEVIQQLCQIRQLVMINAIVYWNLLRHHSDLWTRKLVHVLRTSRVVPLKSGVSCAILTHCRR